MIIIRPLYISALYNIIKFWQWKADNIMNAKISDIAFNIGSSFGFNSV